MSIALDHDIKKSHIARIKHYVQLLPRSELMSSLETTSLGISSKTRGAVPQ